jgi:RNA polymerase sigma-70 factor (ECF subfamily)
MKPLLLDRGWFVDQVREHQARLRAMIRSLGVRAEAVDDIAQDALILAWEKLSEFEPDGDFGAWVRAIARRLVANERRKESRRRRILAGEVTDMLLQLAADSEGPLMRLERDESLCTLRTCLEGLPPDSRELIRLRYFEQLSPGSIAGQLDRPSNAVRQGLLRLRRALLACVERSTGAFSAGGGGHDRPG